MTLHDLIYDTRDFLTSADVAPLLGRDPQSLRSQAQADQSKLGFPVIIVGSRVLIPRKAFLAYCGEVAE